MRHSRFGLLAAGLTAVAACTSKLPSAPGVDAAAAAHFDSLVAQATAAGQPKRAAALQIALRALADGASAKARFLASSGPSVDTLGTITWSIATVKVAAGRDSITDSLLVQTSWRGANADPIIVTRVGDAIGLGTPIQSQLGVLGLSTADTVKAVFIGPTDNAVVADSGSLSGRFAIQGTPCVYATVQNSPNDSKTPGACFRVGVLWQFALRFGALHVGVASGGSSGIVVIR